MRVLLLLAFFVSTAAPAAVLRRAMQSATARVTAGDSLCHTASPNVSEEIYLSFAKRRATAQDEDADHALRTLYEWCVADEHCCKAYYLRGCTAPADQNPQYTDFEMFRYLTSHWHDSQYPLTQLLDDSGVCGGVAAASSSSSSSHTPRSIGVLASTAADGDHVLDRMLRRAWVLEMRLQSCQRGQVHCAENQRFIYSPADAEGRCVCADADADCNAVYRKSHLDAWTYSTAALVISGVAVAVLVALDIYKMCLQIPLFRALHTTLRKEHRTGVVEQPTESKVKTFMDALQDTTDNKS